MTDQVRKNERPSAAAAAIIGIVSYLPVRGLLIEKAITSC